MSGTLPRKELRQHWWAFLIVGVTSALGCLMILGMTVTQGQAGSPFAGLSLFVMLNGTLAALVLCHRLVAVEYHAKTQLFLDALPVSRWRMVTIKYCLGLAATALIVSFAFGLTCLLAWHHQLLSGQVRIKRPSASATAIRLRRRSSGLLEYLRIPGHSGYIRFRWRMFHRGRPGSA